MSFRGFDEMNFVVSAELLHAVGFLLLTSQPKMDYLYHGVLI
jgi:hypothetical protein